MEETTRGARWKWGLAAAVIAWVVAAIHGFIHSDIPFMTQLLQPSGAELWLRILTAAVAVWIVLKVRARLNQQDTALASESQERAALRSAADQAGLAIMTLDDSLQIQWANDRLRALTGFVMNNLLGAKFPEALVADESQETAADFLKKARQGTVTGAQFAVKSKSDDSLVVNCSSSLLHDPKTDSRRIVLFLQSVSGLVQEKEELQGQLTEANERISVVEEEKKSISEEHTRIAERASRLEDELRASQEAKDELVKDKEELEAEKDALEKALEDKAAQLADAERQSETLQEAKEVELKELRTKTERETDAIRARSEAEAGRWRQALELAHHNLLSTPLPILFLDEGGHISECSGRAEQLLESIVGTSSLNGQSFASFLEPEAIRGFTAKMQKVFAGDTVEPQLLHLTGDNGHKVTLVCSLSGFRGENGVDRAVLMAHDVTDMQNRLDELREKAHNSQFELGDMLEEVEWERDRCNVILKSITEGILVTDVYHRVVLMNRAAEDILGLRLSDVLQRPVSFAVPERFFRTELERTLDQRLTDNCFSLKLSKTEGELELDVSTSVVKNQNAKGMAVVARLVRQ